MYLVLYLQGRFKYQPNQVRALGMIAGGTGITPMFQVCVSKGFRVFLWSFNFYIFELWISNNYIYIYFFFLEVTRAILENQQDKTNINLIYANVTFDDILLKVNLLYILVFSHVECTFDMFRIFSIF